jgi:aldose 1-epimerase
MTCPANAFQSGDSLLRLEPGETFVGHWGITPKIPGTAAAGGGSPM